MKSCNLCPRKCSVDRAKGETGFCGQTERLRVARAALHMWEEPCISGTRGSGTVFFTGCGLKCVFCQNYAIAGGDVGKEISVDRLAEIFLELQEQGADNLNLVTAGHFAPQIVQALDRARAQGLALPVVYNTSSYEEVETLRMLQGYVDVYLPDLKYVDSRLSGRYSHAPDYFARAGAAIREMVRQAGEPEFVVESGAGPAPEAPRRERKIGVEEYQRRSEAGEPLIMTKGVIVRHLVLPGCAEDSKRVISYLLEEYGSRIFISIMNQYTPLPHVAAYPELNRKVTPKEYEQVVDFALELGIENGFIQEGETAKESFIPAFDQSGV